jgi:quercetin dioxygenase-like cupin family protein
MDVQDNTIITSLAEETPPFVPDRPNVMTARLDIPPGDPGSPPHRHSGPVFGYVLEGELRFELEGDPERSIPSGGTFSEPGGDVIHYQAGNSRSDVWTRVLVVMLMTPGEPMLTYVDEDELAKRAERRAPRPR